MHGYTPLFESIITSTIWQEDSDTKVVWITMLALMNRDRIVEGSIPGIANLSKVSIASAEKAIRKFLGPDKYSRTTAHEGRRIEKVPGGWRILNGDKFQEKMAEINRRASWRKSQAAKRARDKGGDGPLPGELAHVKNYKAGYVDEFNQPIKSNERQS